MKKLDPPRQVFKHDKIQAYTTNALLKNHQIINQFRMNNTFKKPSEKDRVNMMFKKITNNQSFKKSLNFEYLKRNKNSSFTIKKLDYKMVSKFDKGKYSQSMENTTTRASSINLNDKADDDEYYRQTYCGSDKEINKGNTLRVGLKRDKQYRFNSARVSGSLLQLNEKDIFI